jgi:hypothetical protein
VRVFVDFLSALLEEIEQKVIGGQRGRTGIEPGTAGRLRC